MKHVLTIIFLFVATWGSLSAQSAGGGLSVFVPETLYSGGKGTLAFEQGLSTSVGFGSLLSVPVGFAYHAVDGFTLQQSDTASPGTSAAFHGDALIPSAMLQARVGVGPVYAEVFGGGALAWVFSLNPTGDLAAEFAAADETVALSSVVVDPKLGYGWVAGGALGVRFGQISVDLGGTFRALSVPVILTGTVDRVSGGIASRSTLDLPEARALLRGVSIKLGGSYAF